MPEVIHKPTPCVTAVAAVGGPLCALVPLVVAEPFGLEPAAWRLTGVVLWMVAWWTAEVVPVPVTALLPTVVLPALEISPESTVAENYSHPVVFLFLGGFLLAQGLTRWEVHRRIALSILLRTGPNPRRVVLGFLCAGALLSMWVSNTATAVMLLPVGLAAARVLGATLPPHEARRFEVVTLLAIAYGCTVGGVGTLIGSPPNALLAAFLEQEYGYRVGFGEWMAVGVPYVLLTLPLVWLWLTRVAFPVSAYGKDTIRELLQKERAQLGPVRRPEYRALTVFAATALAWLLRPALLGSSVSDTNIALIGGIALFLLPSGEGRERLLAWRHAVKLPWGVLLLFGGGLALADAMVSTGLAQTVANALPHLETRMVAVAAIAGAVLVLTELASNTAIAAAFFPVLAALASRWGENPLLLLLPVALAASGAFMLPVATPPNAVVFGQEVMSVRDMVRAGFALNVVSLCVVVALVTLLATWVFDIQMGTVPTWVKGQ